MQNIKQKIAILGSMTMFMLLTSACAPDVSHYKPEMDEMLMTNQTPVHLQHCQDRIMAEILRKKETSTIISTAKQTAQTSAPQWLNAFMLGTTQALETAAGITVFGSVFNFSANSNSSQESAESQVRQCMLLWKEPILEIPKS